MRPITHSDEVPVPVFTKLSDVDEDLFTSSTSSSNCDDDDDKDIAHEAWNTDQICLYSQSELNDLIRDLNLPKQSAEVLAFIMHEKHLLKCGTSISFYRNREEKLRKYFHSDCQLVQMLRGFFLLWVYLYIVQMTGDFLLIARKGVLSVSCSIMVTSMDLYL